MALLAPWAMVPSASLLQPATGCAKAVTAASTAPLRRRSAVWSWSSTVRSSRADSSCLAKAAAAAMPLDAARLARRPFGLRGPDWGPEESDSAIALRVLPGPEFDQFTVASQALLWSERWRITAQSNRMPDAIEILDWADTRHLADLPPQPTYDQTRHLKKD